MHIISKRPFADAAKRFPNDADAIIGVYNILRKGDFRSPEQLRNVFATLDNFKYRDRWWVIDIGGNNLRLIALFEFRFGCVFIKHIVTHAEYDRICKKYRQ